MRLVFSLLTVLFVMASSTAETRPSRLPTPRPAPDWAVSEWINGDGGQLADLKGKVVVVEFFQLWCPGCNAFSIPLMKKWEQDFAAEIKAGKLRMISIHTVFEGFGYQTPERLKKFVRRKQIGHPVGVDRTVKGDRIPVTMRRFLTSGTPEMAVIDKRGIIRFQEFGGFDDRRAKRLIKKLLREKVG